MANKRKSFGTNTNIALYNQVDGICPICATPLLYEKKGTKYKKYEIAHIYPLNPTPVELSLLKNEERLGKHIDDDDNLIPLCKICHGIFDKPRTVDEYRNLVGIKKELISKIQQREIWHQYQIEADINTIIDSLSFDEYSVTKTNIVYDPKEIQQKTDDTLSGVTKRKIQNNVSDYYSHIKNKLATLDSDNPGVANIISTQIKLFYLKQRKEESSQQNIYKNTVQWILNKSSSNSEDAADIIVSFFVQNCEVF